MNPSEIAEFTCPNCSEQQFRVELPDPRQETQWLIRCDICENRYRLMPNGLIELEGYGKLD